MARLRPDSPGVGPFPGAPVRFPAVVAPSATFGVTPGRQGCAGSAMQTHQNLGRILVLNAFLSAGSNAHAGYTAASALLLVPGVLAACSPPGPAAREIRSRHDRRPTGPDGRTARKRRKRALIRRKAALWVEGGHL